MIRQQLLFLLNSFKIPVSVTQLSLIFAETQIADYFEGFATIAEMVADNLIIQSELMGDTVFFITNDGRLALNESDIALPVQSVLKKIAGEMSMGQHRLEQVRTKYEEIRENVYLVSCSLLELGEVKFEMKLRTRDKKQAEEIAKKFRLEHARIIEDVVSVI